MATNEINLSIITNVLIRDDSPLMAYSGKPANRKFINFQWLLLLEESVFSCWHTMWVLSDVCRLLANNAGLLAINPGSCSLLVMQNSKVILAQQSACRSD